MTGVEISLLVVGFLLGLSLVGIVNLLKALEKHEDMVELQSNYLLNISKLIAESKEYLQTLDERGIFQSDDEVGTFFQAMKDVQEELNKYVLEVQNEQNK